MDWLLVVAQMCQVSIAAGVSVWDTEKQQMRCQRQLIECVRQLNDGGWGLEKEMADCALKRAKGELK